MPYIKFSKNLSILALTCMLSTMPALAQHQGKKEKDKETVTLNFVNADIQSVIKTVGMITGKNFLIDPRVNGTVNIVSNGPVAKNLVYPTLLSALRLQGFSAVEQNGFVKIIPEADAKLNYTITTDKPIKGGGDRIVTQVYQLQYENAAQLLPVLRPLISPNNVIAAYPATNTLVITDYAENVRRINQIIQSIDQPNQGEIYTIPLKYASAVDVSQLLNRLMPETAQAPGQPGTTPKLVFTVDTRTNSLFIRSDNPAYVHRIRVLAEQMDTPAAAGGNIHVIYLRNAEATKVADTLRALLSGQPTTSTTPQNLQQAAAGAPASGTGGAPGASAAPSFGNTSSAAAAQPTASSIQAYPSTNSLVIVASDPVYNSLRTVIDKLDARRAQVFVEALIVEVTSSKAAEFGIQWQDLTGVSKTGSNIIGGTNFSAGSLGTAPTSTSIIGAAANIATVGAGLNIGIVKGSVSINGQQFLNLGVLARALENDQAANILSTPNILTLDNEEATIIVGQNVPFITGSYSQTSSGTSGSSAANPFQTIDRKDVGLTLKVKPQIAEGGSIKLQLYQEVSSVTTDAARFQTADIITNKRSVQSTVLVDDSQIIVIGGLVQDEVNTSKSGIPVLGSIPILGNLFRSETRNRTKTNLMIFLRPHVLREDKSSAQITEDRYDFIRNQQMKAKPGDHLILPTFDGPQLPPIGDQAQPRYVPPAPPATNPDASTPQLLEDKPTESKPVEGKQ
ncbi:MAG: type II secretion system secretin GspD [Pseudomonadota bacterium]